MDNENFQNERKNGTSLVLSHQYTWLLQGRRYFRAGKVTEIAYCPQRADKAFKPQYSCNASKYSTLNVLSGVKKKDILDNIYMEDT